MKRATVRSYSMIVADKRRVTNRMIVQVPLGTTLTVRHEFQLSHSMCFLHIFIFIFSTCAVEDTPLGPQLKGYIS